MSIKLDTPLLRLKLLLFSLTCPICPIWLPKTPVVTPLITWRSAYSMYMTPSTLHTTFHPPGRPARSDLNLPSTPPSRLSSTYPATHRSWFASWLLGTSYDTIGTCFGWQPSFLFPTPICPSIPHLQLLYHCASDDSLPEILFDSVLNRSLASSRRVNISLHIRIQSCEHWTVTLVWGDWY